jgi:hypothetical protein
VARSFSADSIKLLCYIVMEVGQWYTPVIQAFKRLKQEDGEF